jgi:hypothetical protein
MTVTQLGCAGWLAGLIAYHAALALLYGQSISRGDFWPVVINSLVAFGLCYWLLYLPILRAVRRWLPEPRSVWVFPVTGMLLGILPTALLARFWGGSLQALLTPEALLFYILFAVVGLVVGICFTRLDSRQ